MSDEVQERPTAERGAVRRIGHVPELDGLRGIGAVLAVTVHFFMLLVPTERKLPTQVPGTFIWMDMFFVLSGFLITALLLREQDSTQKVAIWPFYRRRALRLLPALYVLLGFHVVYAMVVGLDMRIERESIVLASVYVLNFRMDNILTARVSEGLTQLWSLSVEEQFYLVWPVVVAVLLPVRRRLGTVVAVLVPIIVIVAVRRRIMFDDADGANWFRLYTHTDTRADSLLIGALLAYLWVHGKVVRRFVAPAAWACLAFITWCLFTVRMDEPFAYRGGFTVMAVAFSIVILACLETSWSLKGVFSWKPLRQIGMVSYGLYLWHVPVQIVVSRIGSDWNVFVRVGVACVAMAAVTLLSWVLVEKPALRWKDRLEGRDRPAKAPSASATAEAAP